MAKSHRISKVTTRAGDKGTTKLATGRTVTKYDPLIKVVGAVDELNSHIGLLLTHIGMDDTGSAHIEILKHTQQHLFDMGAVLAMEGAFTVPDRTDLENATAALNESLPPLTEFVLPGGGLASAQSHVCRATCRRAESQMWELVAGIEADTTESAFADCGRYLNRLSDYFFVLARTLVDAPEEQWRKP